MATTYFTVFDRNYAARGLVMIESLRRFCDRDNRILVLALDEDAGRVSKLLADEVVRIEDLGDAEFMAAKDNRTFEEFCWTCAPVLSDFMVRRSKPGDTVVYLDADLFFFSSPSILLDEIGEDGSILVHPHRFSSDKAGWEKSVGTFNVGFVAFRVSREAMACTARWRGQVLDLCVKDPAKGLCGDQGYLNEWPDLYGGLRVMQNIGGGVAPWNANSYRVAAGPHAPSVDEVPAVFFHFHQLRIVDCERHRFLGAIPAIGYDFPEAVWNVFYTPYLVRLKRKALKLNRQGIALCSNQKSDLQEFRHYVAIRHIMPVLESWTTAVFWRLRNFHEQYIVSFSGRIRNRLK